MTMTSVRRHDYTEGPNHCGICPMQRTDPIHQTGEAMPGTIRTDEVRYVKELYPRLKPIDDVIERYRDALDQLPPIVVAGRPNDDGTTHWLLVDGYHRWQAHVREGAESVAADDLGNISDAEIVRESIRRNATHGQQLSRQDKQRMAGKLWSALADLPSAERVKDIADLLAVSERAVHGWTKDARKAEKQAQQDRAWDLWLDCHEFRAIASMMDGGPDEDTIGRWVSSAKSQFCENADAPESRQHFDIWQFATTDRDGGGAQSYFGALPPQVMENLLWFYTEPGQTVVDLFAGSGTTVDVAKAMGRRIWAADIRGNHYSPHLPIHQHDATTGWPDDAPRKADLVFLDPPYWRQAAGRYSNEPGELAEMDLEAFYAAWREVVIAASVHTDRIAFIVSPVEVKDEDTVVDLAAGMLDVFSEMEWRVERRIIVPYSTQQATGQQVEWARANKKMLKLYRDLVVLTP